GEESEAQRGLLKAVEALDWARQYCADFADRVSDLTNELSPYGTALGISTLLVESLRADLDDVRASVDACRDEMLRLVKKMIDISEDFEAWRRGNRSK